MYHTLFYNMQKMNFDRKDVVIVRKLLCFLAALMLSFNGVRVEASGRNTSTRNQTQQQRRQTSRTSTSREKARNTKNGRKNEMRKQADRRFKQQWDGQD